MKLKASVRKRFWPNFLDSRSLCYRMNKKSVYNKIIRKQPKKMFIFVRVNLLMVSLVIFNLTIINHQLKHGENQEEQEVNCNYFYHCRFQMGRVGWVKWLGNIDMSPISHLVLFVLLLIRYHLRPKFVLFVLSNSYPERSNCKFVWKIAFRN